MLVIRKAEVFKLLIKMLCQVIVIIDINFKFVTRRCFIAVNFEIDLFQCILVVIVIALIICVKSGVSLKL